MNLHEECLLKYLLNPLDLSNSTERLKMNISMIERGLSTGNLIKKGSAKVVYLNTRL